MRGQRQAAAVALCLAAAPAVAAAQSFPPVTDRDFAIDLYQGAVLGSTRIIGMGGAQVAMAEGAAGMTANPASPAVRPATSTDRWDWDVTIDWLNPELGDDFDNNGAETTAVDKTLILTLGAVVQYKKWGFGFNAGTQQFHVTGDDGALYRLDFNVAHVALARSFLDDTVTLGVGSRAGTFALNQGAQGNTKLIELTGAGLEVGGTWSPKDRDIRLGAAGAVPVRTDKLLPGGCTDPEDCAGFILPREVIVPWQVSAGAAWRRAGTRWNRKVASRWRDERALLVAVDVVVTGPVADGHGVEAYVNKQLQPSGNRAAVSVRAGADYEWKPGWFRVRGGSYYASPILVGKHIYLCSRDGLTTIIEANPDGMIEVARNKLPGAINASPVAVGGKLLIRTDTHLYCIGK